MHVMLVGEHPEPGQPPRGGVQRVISSLRRALSSQVRVTLVAPFASQDATYTDDAGDMVFLSKPRWPGSISYWNVTARRIGQHGQRLKPDVVHVQDAAGLALGWPRTVRHVPVVFTDHGVLDKEIRNCSNDFVRRMTAIGRARLVQEVEQAGRRRSSEIIVINDYVTEEMSDIASRSHHKIPNPVERAFLTGEPSPKTDNHEFRILQIGVIRPLKNTLAAIDLIAALNTLGHPARLILIGPASDENYLAQCRKRTSQLGLNDKIDFLGEMQPPNLVQQLSRADLLLLTSLQETAPMVAAEALCRGVPVAAPRAFGLKYMVDDLRNGVLCDGADAQENARKIADFFSYAIDHAAIYKTARALYDFTEIAAKTIEVYRRAMTGRVQATI